MEKRSSKLAKITDAKGLELSSDTVLILFRSSEDKNEGLFIDFP